MERHSAHDLRADNVAMDVDSVEDVVADAAANRDTLAGSNLHRRQHDSQYSLWEMDVDMTAESDDDTDEHAFLIISLMFIVLGAAFGTMDWRSLRADPSERITIRSDFFPKLKAQRSPKAYRKTLRCMPESFDALCSFLETPYCAKYGLPGKNTQYAFDHGLGVLLTYYGNGCGQDGDGIGGAAAQLGMSRPVASRYIDNLEKLLFDMMDDVIYFPAPHSEDEWNELADGFAARKADFPDVACIFDGTLIHTRRPSDFQGFYDKSGKPSYNCLAAIDYRFKFRYLGVFSGSNSDQSMWNQSAVLGARARELCPPGINWLGDAGFKLWPFLMVPFDERGGKRLTKIQRCYNYHLSETRILVECVFGRLKSRFKVLHGVTDRRKHTTNVRMICAAAVLHNLLIDIGDKQFKYKKQSEEARREEVNEARQVMASFNRNWDRTPAEVKLAIEKRNAYALRFYQNDNE
ncbi:hypothetical protein F444_02683 [Phytophthora nicotianae P1976]|uniref:DDE Tnp4 domain-containing protein n=1 Tax=Phytophthora nicotianae P1976 TaxID=1317066 RepID=A0A081AWJ3_PHYNI|nr:hypothetical protein F444_02683 [Phytophthora nicotianae P1976]